MRSVCLSIKQTIEALIDAGAPLEATDNSGQTPLHAAAGNGCLAAARCLVRCGASPLARDGPLTDGMLPQEVAATWGEDALAKFLTESREVALKRMRSSAAQRGR